MNFCLTLYPNNLGVNKASNQNGVLQTADPWMSGDADITYSVAWGDVDGDGDLDLAAGNYGQANKVYLNQGGFQGGVLGMLQTAADTPWISGDIGKTLSVVFGDVDGDGDLDLAAGNSDRRAASCCHA